MSTFKERLVEEKKELDEKIEKLKSFQLSENFGKIDGVQQTLLNIQSKTMEAYSQILLERLAWIS